MSAVPVLLESRVPGLLFQDVFVGSGKRFQAVNRLNENDPSRGGGGWGRHSNAPCGGRGAAINVCGQCPFLEGECVTEW
jgi:hypothetical protein